MNTISVLVGTSALLLSSISSATIISTFSDRSVFENSLTIFSVETFNDDSGAFHTTPLDVGDFSFSVSGVRDDYVTSRNYIDQPPIQFSSMNVDGSAIANMSVRDGTEITLSFENPISAFGADFRLFDDTIIVADGASLQILTETIDDEFFGFISDSTFNEVVFRGIGTDGWGIDNVTYSFENVAVSEPSVLALIVAGILGIGIARRRG
jgi:hypothetical protein